MRIPRTKDLNKNSFRHNRKDFKKEVRQSIKGVFKNIRNLSKNGKTSYTISLSSERDDYYYWIHWLSFRWIKRNTDLNITIREDDIHIAKDGSKYVDRLFINIKWS